jgi:outer membrane receptor for ferrienterochelin and colicins
MIKKYASLIIVLLLGLSIAKAQQVRGRVIDNKGFFIPGATVFVLESTQKFICNDSGYFSMPAAEGYSPTLIVSAAGFITDTVIIDPSKQIVIRLLPGKAMKEVIVTGNRNPAYISKDPIKTEVISSAELTKAACCDLAGCFETQATVQPQTTNIITNAKELRILGLSGIYNQILIDGFPIIQGLTYTYGISSIPGPLVENIFVAKGSNSVLQGFESISGQINVITKDPASSEKLLLNAYLNSFGESQYNAYFRFGNGNWKNITALHVTQPAQKIDRDNDNFMDVTQLKRYQLWSKWKNGSEEEEYGWSSQITLRYLHEERIGGQMNFNYKNDRGTKNAYGQFVEIDQPELTLRSAFRFAENKRILLIGSSLMQQQQSYFGLTNYKSDQSNAYLNLQYEYAFGKGHTLKTGVSYRYFNLKEDISFKNDPLDRTYDSLYLKKENIPGVFAEQSLNIIKDKLLWLIGVRMDDHNEFGLKLSPRSLVKFELTEKTTLRASVGSGWRTANIFSENIGMLVSSRDIIFAEKLTPEEAINYGFNATQKFRGLNVNGYVSMDLYNTSFRNQIFPDYDSDPNKAILKNYKGRSVSTGFQLEANCNFFEKWNVRMGYVYLDVYQEKEGKKYVLPFNTNHRINASFSFAPKHKKWHADANFHWYGEQRLPNTDMNPTEYQRPEKSDPFMLINTQFTYAWKKWEWYAGVENIFDFRQKQPIIGWQDPFGPYFDTQFVWGPTRGREAYLGLRFKLKE